MRRIRQTAPPSEMVAPGVRATAKDSLSAAQGGPAPSWEPSWEPFPVDPPDRPGFQWNRTPVLPHRMDSPGPSRTALGDLRNRRLGVRVAPGALPESLSVAGGLAASGFVRLGRRHAEGPILGSHSEIDTLI